jgi:hypothetical protein
LKNCVAPNSYLGSSKKIKFSRRSGSGTRCALGFAEWPTGALVWVGPALRIETGAPSDFDRPATREEALDRLEGTAGPQARQMLEQLAQAMQSVQGTW